MGSRPCSQTCWRPPASPASASPVRLISPLASGWEGRGGARGEDPGEAEGGRGEGPLGHRAVSLCSCAAWALWAPCSSAPHASVPRGGPVEAPWRSACPAPAARRGPAWVLPRSARGLFLRVCPRPCAGLPVSLAPVPPSALLALTPSAFPSDGRAPEAARPPLPVTSPGLGPASLPGTPQKLPSWKCPASQRPPRAG